MAGDWSSSSSVVQAVSSVVVAVATIVLALITKSYVGLTHRLARAAERQIVLSESRRWTDVTRVSDLALQVVEQVDVLQTLGRDHDSLRHAVLGETGDSSELRRLAGGLGDEARYGAVQVAKLMTLIQRFLSEIRAVPTGLGLGWREEKWGDWEQGLRELRAEAEYLQKLVSEELEKSPEARADGSDG